jgi:hypothetical protein
MKNTAPKKLKHKPMADEYLITLLNEQLRALEESMPKTTASIEAYEKQVVMLSRELERDYIMHRLLLDEIERQRAKP